MTQQERPKLAGDADAIVARDVKAEKIEYLWRHRIPKASVSIVAGKPDQGKGLFAAYVAAEVSKRGGRVIYSASEDGHAQFTRPRLEAAGANLDNILLWNFLLPTEHEELARRVFDQGIDLIIIDPFADHLDGVSERSQSIRKVTRPLKKLAEQSGAAIIVIAHAVKKVSKNAHPLACIGGSSSGLPAAARAGYVLGINPDDNDERVLCSVKNNGQDKPKALKFELDLEDVKGAGEIPAIFPTKETEFDAIRLITHEAGDGKIGRKPEKRAAAAEWLTQYLAAAIEAGTAPVLAGEVKEDAKQYGISKNTLVRACQDLDVVKSGKSGPKVTWTLPADIQNALGLQPDDGAGYESMEDGDDDE